MSNRNYSAEEKLDALERLVINRGDVALTSAQLGIPPRTLLRWRQKLLPPSPHHFLRENDGDPSLNFAPAPLPLSSNVVQALTQLQGEMLTIAGTLSRAIEPAIMEAPLGQRVAAFSQLIDRIVRLSVHLPNPAVQFEIVGAEDYEPVRRSNHHEDRTESAQTAFPAGDDSQG